MDNLNEIEFLKEQSVLSIERTTRPRTHLFDELFAQINKNGIKKVPENEWIAKWLIAYDLSYTKTGYSWVVDKKLEEVSAKEIIDQAWSDGLTTGNKFSKTVITDLLSPWLDARTKGLKALFLDSLNKVDNQKAESLLNSLVDAMFPYPISSEDRAVNMAIIHSWIIQVKRSIFGLDKISRMVLVLVGRENGTYKSTFTRLLSKPVEDFGFACEIGAAESLQDGTKEVWGSNYILRFDELSGMDKADQADFKSMVTKKDFKTRLKYARRAEKIDCIASVIASTNHPISHSFKDTTGMSRWFPIPIDKKMNIDALLSFDFFALWSSIEHNVLKMPIEDYQHHIASRQEYERTISPTELFFVEEAKPKDGSVFVSFCELYAIFENFCKSEGIKSHVVPTKRLFIKEIRALGLKEHRTAEVKGFLVNPSLSPDLELSILGEENAV